MSIAIAIGLALRCDKCGRCGPASLVLGASSHAPTTLPPPSRYEAHRAGWVMSGTRDL